MRTVYTTNTTISSQHDIHAILITIPEHAKTKSATAQTILHSHSPVSRPFSPQAAEFFKNTLRVCRVYAGIPELYRRGVNCTRTRKGRARRHGPSPRGHWRKRRVEVHLKISVDWPVAGLTSLIRARLTANERHPSETGGCFTMPPRRCLRAVTCVLFRAFFSLAILSNLRGDWIGEN